LPVNVPTLVKGTETAEPPDAVEQNGEPPIVPVAIVADTFTCTWLLVTEPHEKVEIQTT
jgi:hypothetical protein